jgi:hypothetical protein
MSFRDDTYITLEEWAGAKYLNLTLVFTDIVESTRIGVEIGDHEWIKDLLIHFSRAREVASQFDSYVVKTIGDAVMVAFRAAPDAISFAIEFAENTGVDYIGVRVGINSGFVQIRENDIFGLNVNYTSRIQRQLDDVGILVSDVDKKDFEKAFGRRASEIRFIEKEVDLKSFGLRTIWLVITPSLRQALMRQRVKRKRLLNDLPAPSS